MRVIAGSHKGRRIVAPDGVEVRPTSDRARQATFNRLASMDLIDGGVFIDLFAGSGALGIEALSRGADRAVFVDSSRRSVDVVRANLVSLGIAGEARVVQSDAFRFLAGTDETFDVALVDPPYDFDRWDELLEVLPAAYAVVESDRPIELPASWAEVRSSRYGRATIAVIERERR